MEEPLATARLKYTPGPWAAFSTDGHTNIVAFKDRTTCVFSLPGHDKSDPDVRLIAACPPMYEYILGKADGGDPEAIKIIEAIHATR